MADPPLRHLQCGRLLVSWLNPRRSTRSLQPELVPPSSGPNEVLLAEHLVGPSRLGCGTCLRGSSLTQLACWSQHPRALKRSMELVDISIDPGNWVPVSSPPEAEIPKLLKTKLFARS